MHWLHLVFIVVNLYVALAWCDRYSGVYWLNMCAVAFNTSALLRSLLLPY